MKVIIAWCVENFRDSVVFTKSLVFILGLVFSYKLVENVFFNILITHLSGERGDDGLRNAAIVVNLQEGTSAVRQIFFAIVADAYSGLFKMVVCSTTLSIIGLLLTYLAAPKGGGFLDLRVFYPALVLMTLSQAAEAATLPSFLDDQVVASDRPDTQEEEERALKRSDFWWKFVSFLTALFALFGPLRDVSFRKLAIDLAIAAGIAFFWFLLGIKFYTCVEPTGSALSDVVLVIQSAILERNVEYPDTPEQLSENSSGDVQILPHVSWLRWLDRAAVVQESFASGHTCTVEQVKGVKFLLKMLPLWMTFLTFSVVAASGSTFFLNEADSITDDAFPILFFTIFKQYLGSIISEITDYVLEKLCRRNKNNAQRMMLVRIGIGMICCVLCCIAAWASALHMLRVVKNYGEVKNNMSVYWLTPQYFLLAVMEGLSSDGLQNFYDSQVSRSTSKYGPPFGECVMGVGKFVSIVCILILSKWFKWFKDEANPRHLDRYYAMLAIISCVNFIVYCFVARWYGDDTFLSEDEADIETGNAGQVDIELGNSDHLQVKSFQPQLVSRSLSRKVHCDPIENSTNSERSQTLEDSCDDHEAETLKPVVFDSAADQVSLFASDSTTERETGNADEAARNGPIPEQSSSGDSNVLLESTDQVPLLPSKGLSDAPLLSGARSFPPPSSRPPGVHKRFLSRR